MSRPDKQSAAPAFAAPRFAMGWAALCYAVATLCLAYPALTGHFLVNPHSDQYIAGFAFRDFAAQSLRAGMGIPHWNPYIFGGMPYVAAMHGDIFYPTALLRVIMPTDAAMTWGFAIHLFLAGLFTYGYLRAWGLGFIESLTGGMAYLLSGPIASYASPGHDGKLFVSALLPLALWQLIRGIRDGRNWAWGAFALTVGLGVLSPHPQLLQYLLLTSGAFGLFLAFGTDSFGKRLDRSSAIKRIGFALAAVLLGMAIGAIQYLPVREYVAWSPRAGGRDYAYATSYSFPLVEIFNIYLPQFTGILDKYWGPNGIHLHSEYLGGPMLLLASLGFGGDGRKSFRRFWIGTGIVAFLWMLGGNTPFFVLIYNLIPGTKFFRAPSTIIYVFAFSASVMAALGMEKLLARRINPRVIHGWLAVGLISALVASVGGFASFARANASGRATAIARQQGYPDSAISQILDQILQGYGSHVIVGAWRSLAFLIIAAALAVLYVRGKTTLRVTAFALVGVMAVDLWSIGRQYWMFSPPAKVLYASDPAIEYLKAQKEPGRVVVLGNPDTSIKRPDPYFGGDGLGTGTGLWIHGIRSITGYHGNELGRYQQLSSYRIVPGADPAIVSPMFWRHENVRYLYTNSAVGDTSFKLRVGPVRNSAGSTVYVYELGGDHPYAWLATGAANAPDDATLPAIIDPRFDPRRLAVFDTSVKNLPAPPPTMPPPLISGVKTTDFGAGRATLTLDQPAPAGSALVVAENFFPGWRATVDGKAQPAYRADYNLIGVVLPEGARRVEISFHDDAVDRGKVVTFVALFLAVAALAAGTIADRRRLA